VAWKSSSSGSFSADICTLSGTAASASCSVNYTPNASGSEVITASYGGSTKLHAAAQPTTLVVSGPLRSSWLDNRLILAGVIGGVGAVGILVGIAVIVLSRRTKSKP
jgi:hypothetical protein